MISPEVFSALTIFAAGVTAAATIALWRVTQVLANETRKMAAAAAQPQVVASIESNDWSFIHADLVVANTGNSTAYDIEICFDPPLVVELENQQEPTPTPFERVSLLKPGQELRSWIGKIYPLIDTIYTVTIGWRKSPEEYRETYSYTLNMGIFKSMHRLGSGDPLIQIANSTKSIKEDIHRIIGSGKLQVDAYTTHDRTVERLAWEHVRQDAADPQASMWRKLIAKIWRRGGPAA